jgi:hypothetical protein
MKRKKLLFPEDLEQSLGRRFESQHRNWLQKSGEWPLVIALGSPTEQGVSEDVASVRAWIAAWSGWRGAGEISWEERRWPRLGQHRIPTTIRLFSAEQVAAAVGQQARWALASTRFTKIAARWPILAQHPSLPRHFDILADYSNADFNRLLSLLGWLEENPKSGLYIRQIPVEGIDTKWFERRKGIVTELISAIKSNIAGSDLLTQCGLRSPRTRIRIRLLCPHLRNVAGGLEDIEAPIGEIASLPLSPAKILIVENLETGLALPPAAGVAAFMKLGNAVSVLESISWIRGIDKLYWGDIDTYGYLILDRARKALPELKSLLMDKDTLLGHRNLWVEEPVQTVSDELIFLNGDERLVYNGLRRQQWGDNIRLEQERIPWNYVLKTLKGNLKLLDCKPGYSPEPTSHKMQRHDKG